MVTLFSFRDFPTSGFSSYVRAFSLFGGSHLQACLIQAPMFIAFFFFSFKHDTGIKPSLYLYVPLFVWKANKKKVIILLGSFKSSLYSFMCFMGLSKRHRTSLVTTMVEPKSPLT